MKVEQHLEALRQLDEQASLAIQRASKLAEQKIPPRYLARAIGALLVASTMAAGLRTNEKTIKVPAESIAVVTCSKSTDCTPPILPGLPRKPEAMPKSKPPTTVTPSATTTTSTTEIPTTTQPPAPPSTVAKAVTSSRFSAAEFKRNTVGADISYPNCDTPIRPDVTFGIVGVNGGKPFTANSCLAPEAAKFKQPGLYVNTSLQLDKATAENDPTIPCPLDSSVCASYRWGYRAGQFAVNTASTNGVISPNWYVDVETENSWSTSPDQNRASIAGTMDAIRTDAAKTDQLPPNQIHEVIYGNKRMWSIITGGWRLPDTPVWYATGVPEDQAMQYCSKPDANFTGGGVVMAQTQNQRPEYPYALDINLPC